VRLDFDKSLALGNQATLLWFSSPQLAEKEPKEQKPAQRF
jgi:hypothetical protein